MKVFLFIFHSFISYSEISKARVVEAMAERFVLFLFGWFVSSCCQLDTLQAT